jgi:hypothetical protein
MHKRIKLKIETFQRKPQEPVEPWAQTDWEKGEEQERPEDLSDYEPFVVDGGIDALDVQSYMRVRDDRVAVCLKNGAVLSAVCTLEEFELALERVGL